MEIKLDGANVTQEVLNEKKQKVLNETKGAKSIQEDENEKGTYRTLNKLKD